MEGRDEGLRLLTERLEEYRRIKKTERLKEKLDKKRKSTTFVVPALKKDPLADFIPSIILDPAANAAPPAVVKKPMFLLLMRNAF
ncbi:hypothetical protein HDU84_002532 [Entophlyctis sp. JEL0112]|nr:hypothetical protein HDU84_002532 [Entophlyctis sp. JEL0112]